MSTQNNYNKHNKTPYLFINNSYLYTSITIISIISIVTFYYISFINNFFAYDDFKYIENLFSPIKNLLLGYNSTRFFSNLIFAPIFIISGYNPAGYNLFNMILHIINALLIVQLFYRISSNRLIGWTSGLFFAASAVLSDALFWKCAHNGMLSALFSIISLLLYIHFSDTGSRKSKVASVLFFIVAMFSKEDAAALPLLILSFEVLCRREKLLNGLKFTFPYVIIVIGYILIGKILRSVFGVSLEHYERFLSFRPLHSIFGGYYSFLWDPRGELNSPIYAIITGIACGILIFTLSSNKRLLLWAILGIFITFLPSSLSSLVSYNPKYIFMSASRYLYFPSAFTAFILACILADIRSRYGKFLGVAVIVSFIVIFIVFNYKYIIIRGTQWQQEAEPVKIFLQAMKFNFPYIPPNTYIFVIDPPTGRAYVQQALRAFYKNPSITWIADPQNFSPPSGSLALLFVCNWSYGMKAVTINSMAFNQNIFKN